MSKDTKQEQVNEQASDGQTVSVPELGSVDSMTEALALSMPETVEADENFELDGYEPVEPETPKTAENAQTDKSGETFDPELHRSDADGNPVLTQKGNFAKKPGRGGSRVGKSSKQKSAEEAAKPPSPDELAKTACKAQGLQMMTLTYMGGVMAFGPDGRPDFEKAVPGEGQQIAEAWEQFFYAEYLRTGEIPSPPPWAAIAVATLTYAGTRLTNSKPAQSRISAAKDAFVRRVAVPAVNWWKSRKKKPAPKAREVKKAENFAQTSEGAM